MAQRRGSELGGQDGAPDAEETQPNKAPEGRGDATGNPAGLPDGIRRLIALGLAGMFSTQESLRQTVGDALPKEWVDFAADQSERTRAEFLERLAGELARTIENIDLARVMQQALEGRTLEVHARIRMLPDDDETGTGGGLRITMTEDEKS